MTTNDTVNSTAVAEAPATTAETPGTTPAGMPSVATDSRASWTISLWDERIWKRLTLPLTVIVVVAIALA